MNAPVALLVVLLSQLGFWALLRAGFFLTALGANVVFWCVAFPAWTEAGRRWWKTSLTPGRGARPDADRADGMRLPCGREES